MRPESECGHLQREVRVAMHDQPANRSRRLFLKALGLAGAAGASAALPQARAGGREGEALVTVLNIGNCIGCGACVEACREANSWKYPRPEKPYPKMVPNRVKVAEWSDKQDVTDRLTPYNWIYVQSAEVEYQGKTYAISIPRRCLHCANPPCANLCPWGAALKQSNGIVRINDATCLGGSKCKSVCPWSIPERQTGVGLYLKLLPSVAGNGVMYKCDRCYDRIATGAAPACIEVCPMEVQTIGPRSQMIPFAHELAQEMNGFLYGEIENGGTHTLYVSPVPFELLDEAIAKGPGRPHLAPVENSMETAQNLSWALLVAPIAGTAAGLLTAGRRLIDTSERSATGTAATAGSSPAEAAPEDSPPRKANA
jgi:formate dehydrogenase iron-sulfur subunit